jgi:hypothetical protein
MDRGSPTLPTKTMPTMISNYRHMRLTIDTISFILGNLIICIGPNKFYSRIVRVKKIVEWFFLEMGMVAKCECFSKSQVVVILFFLEILFHVV